MIAAYSLLCYSCLIRCTISIKAMRTDMVIGDIRKFFHGLIKCFLCLKLIQIGTFIFQGVKVSLHWCIVIWVSSFAHALCHMDRFAEFHKCPGGVLGTLIAVQNQFPFDCWL